MNIKYNNDIGAFINTETGEKATQSELLMWTAENPMEVKVGEPKLTKAKAPGKIVEEGVESITIKEKI
jgi:ribosomal protein L21